MNAPSAADHDRGDRLDAELAQGGRSAVANPSLAEVMDRCTAPGQLCRTEGAKVRCLACGHRCLLADGQRGICKVRFNQKGELRVPFGYVAGAASDPVEKKPLFHVFPGSEALTFGMLGCNFHCSYCQNWVSSQALKDTEAWGRIEKATPAQLVSAAQRYRAKLVVSSYNEPLISAEWAAAVFQRARPAGLLCAMVSNGNGTPEVLEFLRPWMAALKVDLKTFDNQRYRSLGGTLKKVTETIRCARQLGFWIEVVTLLVPGFNDSDAELRDMARFLVSTSPDIPWHITAFHPDYRMQEPRRTRVSDLVRAADIGAAEGLRYVYAGNLPGQVGGWEDTRCPKCKATLIARSGFLVREYDLTQDGRCPQCLERIPGIWPGATPDCSGPA